jgi:adenosine/AMP kinase
MVEVKSVESSDGKKGNLVKMSGNPIECTAEAISIVEGLYQALKKHPAGEMFADAFCEALHDGVSKGDEELEEAARKAEEQIGEANDFLRKFVDALKR